MTLATRPPISGRRRVPRRVFESPVGVLLGGTYGIERAYQVGEGGIMIACEREKLLEGRQLSISFFLPAGDLVVVRGIVRAVLPAERLNPERYSLEFMNVDFQAKRAIRNFVAAATREDGQVI